MASASLHRRSIRLSGRDYSWPGTYFVTVCTVERKCILGRIENRAMRENLLGRFVRKCWMQIPKHFPTVELDAFVVMPNHVHGILQLHRRVDPQEEQRKIARFGKPQPDSIAMIVAAFKAAVTREARRALNRPAFVVWQRNYYERIIRDTNEYREVCRYISQNPSNWSRDEENQLPTTPPQPQLPRVGASEIIEHSRFN